MTSHLTAAQLAALVDGELAGDDLRVAKNHTDTCLACANRAIDDWMLKTAVAKAGRRYDAPAEFRDRMSGLIAQEALSTKSQSSVHRVSAGRQRNWAAFTGWLTAAVLLIALGTWGTLRYRSQSGSDAKRAALVAEACDLHIAMLAANQPPQVISSDRHTVKPWFQGKLPFTFNLPESLPTDTTLDGANLAYLENRPVAQLLFSIGRHHVSVFVEQKNGASISGVAHTSHAGFQVAGFGTADLDVVGVSDVDPLRLAALMNALEAAQVHR
jgi:anti-sigma factor RsiW